jgi:hypothetical protein
MLIIGWPAVAAAAQQHWQYSSTGSTAVQHLPCHLLSRLHSTHPVCVLVLAALLLLQVLQVVEHQRLWRA